MIHTIDILLCAWGRWAIAHAKREVGYPSTSPMFSGVSSGVYGSDVPQGVGMNFDMAACDLSVAKLPAVHRCIVIHHYQHQGSLRDTARVCGISYKSVQQYLNKAHVLISQELEAYNCGA